MNNDAKIFICPVLLGSSVNPRDSRRVKASCVLVVSTLSFSAKNGINLLMDYDKNIAKIKINRVMKS